MDALLMDLNCGTARVLEGWMRGKEGWRTIFNAVLQLQRLAHLVTYREGNILQLTLLIRDMLARRESH